MFFSLSFHGREAIHLLCIKHTSMRCSGSMCGFVSEVKKDALSLSSLCCVCLCVFVCASLEGRECKGMFSGETQPQCMLGRRGVMTEKDLELLRGQPADSPLTSANTACH